MNCLVFIKLNKSIDLPFIWSRPITTGPPPSARGGHSAFLYGSNMYVFAGHYYEGKGIII